MKSLEVFDENNLIGFLTFENETFSFQYDEQWIKTGYELSPHINFNEEANSVTIKNFISNLLPEGNALDDLVTHLQISKSNHFGLISAIGSETTGALRFGTFENTKESFREISYKELSLRIDDINTNPISIWDEKPRLSMAGVQAKLPVIIMNNKLGLADGKLASTHILKFDTKEENITINEYLCMNIAKLCKLDVEKFELIKVGKHYVLKVERFDRIFNKDKVDRLHIIDGCQALNLPVSYKYERVFGKNESLKHYREGASFEKLFNFTQKCTSPVKAIKKITSWLCINLILGNKDAHGKNISFIVKPHSKLEVAPFYDITNVSLYGNKYDQDFAMAIGNQFDEMELTIEDIKELCFNIDINFYTFKNELLKICSLVKDILDENKYKQDIPNEFENFVDVFTINVNKRIKRIIKLLLR